MDIWGIGIFVIGMILYFVTKRQAIWLFASGVGAGIFIGAVWAVYLVNHLIDNLAP